MKKIYKLALSLLFGVSFASMAQENMGIGTVSPDNSAVLEIQSNNKGLLIPRLSIESRNLINKPATGLLIYQTGLESGFYFFNGKNWKSLSNGDEKAVALDAANWSKTGDAGISSVSNFLGTTDGNPLNFRINNISAGHLGIDNNTFYGMNSGGLSLANSATFNTAFGFDALKANTTASYNVAIGANTLKSSTSGGRNVAIGAHSLEANVDGANNMAIGLNALRDNISGNDNVAIGRQALIFSTGSRNTGIGTDAGLFNTGNDNVFIGHAAGYNETGSGKLYISNSTTATPLVYGDFSAKFVTIGDVPASNLKRIDAVTAGGYNLLVKGGILTEKVKVALVSTTDWADYVFEQSYKEKMMTLEEVEKFTISNKHLPNVPSAQDMVDKGMEVGQTSKMFMEKIEELTLYMIELNKEVKALKAENEVLKRK